MTNYDGTDAFTGKTVTGDKLDSTVLWHGSALPTSPTNEVPANGLFLLNGTAIYENTGTLASPTWTERLATGITSDSSFPSSPTSGDTFVHSTVLDLFLFDKKGRGHWGGSDPTFYDDLAGYATQAEADAEYVSSDTSAFRVNITDNDIDATINQSSGNKRIAKQLTELINGKFVLRFKLDITSMVQPTGNIVEIFIGLSSHDIALTSNQDSLWLGLYNAGGTQDYRLYDTDGAAPHSAGFEAAFTRSLQVETVYVEMIWDGSTSYSVELFSDEYSTSLEKKTGTCSANIANLKYFMINGYDTTTDTSHLTITVDEILLVHGVDSIG